MLRDLPPLAAEDLRLLRFAADYYHHPLGAVVMGALPTRLRRVAGSPQLKERGRYLLTPDGSALADGRAARRAPAPSAGCWSACVRGHLAMPRQAALFARRAPLLKRVHRARLGDAPGAKDPRSDSAA